MSTWGSGCLHSIGTKTVDWLKKITKLLSSKIHSSLQTRIPNRNRDSSVTWHRVNIESIQRRERVCLRIKDFSLFEISIWSNFLSHDPFWTDIINPSVASIFILTFLVEKSHSLLRLTLFLLSEEETTLTYIMSVKALFLKGHVICQIQTRQGNPKQRVASNIWEGLIHNHQELAKTLIILVNDVFLKFLTLTRI